METSELPRVRPDTVPLRSDHTKTNPQSGPVVFPIRGNKMLGPHYRSNGLVGVMEANFEGIGERMWVIIVQHCPLRTPLSKGHRADSIQTENIIPIGETPIRSSRLDRRDPCPNSTDATSHLSRNHESHRPCLCHPLLLPTCVTLLSVVKSTIPAARGPPRSCASKHGQIPRQRVNHSCLHAPLPHKDRYLFSRGVQVGRQGCQPAPDTCSPASSAYLSSCVPLKENRTKHDPRRVRPHRLYCQRSSGRTRSSNARKILRGRFVELDFRYTLIVFKRTDKT
jgi:hypothetical protein